MPIAGPSSNEQGSRRDHDSRDKRGQAGKQQKVLQDSGRDSLPDNAINPIRHWASTSQTAPCAKGSRLPVS